MNRLEQKCVRETWEYYERHGRHELPWRRTNDPYKILVSEVMLQQTQVDRVVAKYQSFLKRFPTTKKLSSASLGDVLRELQGLGYNRRAKMLHECASTITHNRRGQTPTIYEELMELPGIGKYTAGAIMAFAYNKPVPIIETNIRTVVIHHFFHDDVDILDREIMRVIERILDRKNPREWYYAMMDYGASLKKSVGNLNRRSRHYTRQPTFKNSDRQIRGAILKLLTEKSLTRKSFHKNFSFDIQRIDEQLERLKAEGMVVMRGSMYQLPE